MTVKNYTSKDELGNAEEQLKIFKLIGRFKGGILLHNYVTKLDYVLGLEVYNPRLDDLLKRIESPYQYFASAECEDKYATTTTIQIKLASKRFLFQKNGFLSVFDNASPSKEFRWQASFFCGIIICKTVYDITATISLLCFKGYGNLSKAKKVEWNNRGFSTFHAIVVAFASLYLLLLSDLFKEDSDELIINRTSDVMETIFGISIGYVFTDLAMIIWQYLALGGLEYVKLVFPLGFYSLLTVPPCGVSHECILVLEDCERFD
ncbi:hypothetical protein Ddye_015492 [Dipteronia dyeriana]|uniref:TLC domain-containing protein n=1 Tax=Dipteronia dyeriana TaxID=168575 RepID=A0AAD9WZ72_9ROSI|nr:hypothetical protein Ddye_015492 [Dipteronia dyeriana]